MLNFMRNLFLEACLLKYTRVMSDIYFKILKETRFEVWQNLDSCGEWMMFCKFIKWLFLLWSRHLLLGRKAMANLDSILKSRDITLLTKVRLVSAMVFPVVMYGCESWTMKKAEHWRIDAFGLWFWRRLLSPLDSKKIQLVNLKGLF